MSISGPINEAPGLRFHHQIFPSHRAIGINYYPYSAIIGGLVVSTTFAAGAPVATPIARTLTITAGSAYLDGEISTLTASATLSVTPINIRGGVNVTPVYLNPTRRLQVVAVGASAPTTLLNGDAISTGDLYAVGATLLDVDGSPYISASDVFQFNGSAWVPFDLTFSPGDFPAQDGKSRLIGNDIVGKILAGNFSLSPEVDVFWSTRSHPYVNQNSQAKLRGQAALKVADLSLFYIALPLVVTAAFTNGSPTVTVAVASRPAVAQLVTALANTNTIAIDGAALATTGYNAGTGVITLGANYAGTTGAAKVVSITPVTPANIFVLDPALSAVIPSTLQTNP